MSLSSLPSNSLGLTNPPSPASTSESSDAPRTPGENTAELGNTTTNNSNNSNSSKPARKPSRRANTAERRATHNAVERQRRETLNGRFLDLAGLLPNLSQIRRPSKSAIVNSSIAHIHASRRHRMLASRELRLVKMEADALRRELNEWRDRAGIPRVEEPQRGDGFGIVLSGELEVIVPAGTEGMEEEDEDGYNGAGYDDGASFDPYEQQQQQQQRASPVYQQQAQQQQMYHHSQQTARPTSIPMPPPMHASAGHPMIASPTAMAFENPAMGMAAQPQYYAQQQVQTPQEKEWMYQQMMRGRERSGSMSSSGSVGNGGGSSPGMEWMGGASAMNVNGLSGHAGHGGQGMAVGGGMGIGGNVAFAPMF